MVYGPRPYIVFREAGVQEVEVFGGEVGERNVSELVCGDEVLLGVVSVVLEGAL